MYKDWLTKNKYFLQVERLSRTHTFRFVHVSPWNIIIVQVERVQLLNHCLMSRVLHNNGKNDTVSQTAQPESAPLNRCFLCLHQTSACSRVCMCLGFVTSVTVSWLKGHTSVTTT